MNRLPQAFSLGMVRQAPARTLCGKGVLPEADFLARSGSKKRRGRHLCGFGGVNLRLDKMNVGSKTLTQFFKMKS